MNLATTGVCCLFGERAGLAIVWFGYLLGTFDRFGIYNTAAVCVEDTIDSAHAELSCLSEGSRLKCLRECSRLKLLREVSQLKYLRDIKFLIQ